MKKYYFDYAAGTTLDPRVEKAMKPYWSEKFGNPGALHWFGQEASAAVFRARDTIAKALGCNYREIIFTSSATESNNLALRGVIKNFKILRFQDCKIENDKKNNFAISNLQLAIKPKIIVSAIEHDSILETARDLERKGVEVIYLPVDKNGMVDLKKLKESLDERTILVSVMYANNEVGTIEPIFEIAKIISDFKKGKGESQKSKGKFDNLYPLPPTSYPLFHTDAVQAFNYLNCNVNDLGVDLMTLSAQKIYGPKGVGLLYVKGLGFRVKGLENQNKKNNLYPNPYTLYPLITGGSQQEYGLRGGTENVPAIAGFGKAVELVEQSRQKENKRLRKLQEYFLAKMKKIAPDAKLNGSPIGSNRISNNLNFYFLPDRGSGLGSAQDLMIKLDLAGFAVSPGAACTARTCRPSHVLKALGYSDERATGSLRFTFGRPTTKTEVDKLLKVIYNLLLK